MSAHRHHDIDPESQACVDRMINEFLKARSRRFGKSNGNPIESASGTNLKAARFGTTVTPFPGVRTDRATRHKDGIEEL